MQLSDILYLLCKQGITNKLEQAHFLGQASVESENFTSLIENLNYTPGALLMMWPKRFTVETAKKYGRTAEHAANQCMIANIAYADRYGNQGVATGDGWAWRGRGIFQITFKSNYFMLMNWLTSQVGKSVTMESIGNYLLTTDGAILSAIWFWLGKGCGKAAMKDDVEAVTKIVNGGLNGYPERLLATNKYKNILGLK